MKSNENGTPSTGTQYKEQYNENRDCFISKDGKYLCYVTTDLATRRPVTYKYEIGKDGITEELTVFIDELNYQEDLADRYYSEAKDPFFEKSRQKYAQDPGSEEAIDPWDMLSRPEDDPTVEKNEEPENPDCKKVRKAIEENLTEDQKDLFFDHFGMDIQLEEIRKREVHISGKEKSLQSVLNRKNKIIKKVADRAFGVEPVKRKKAGKD
jgi:hypothetical protein